MHCGVSNNVQTNETRSSYVTIVAIPRPQESLIALRLKVVFRMDVDETGIAQTGRSPVPPTSRNLVLVVKLVGVTNRCQGRPNASDAESIEGSSDHSPF